MKGRVGWSFADDGQGGHSVEAGKGEIGQNQVEVIPLQGGEEILPSWQRPVPCSRILRRQGSPDEFGILRVVLEMKDVQVVHYFIRPF